MTNASDLDAQEGVLRCFAHAEARHSLITKTRSMSVNRFRHELELQMEAASLL